MDFPDDEFDFSLNDLTLQLNSETRQNLNQGSVFTGNYQSRRYVIGKVIIDSESEFESESDDENNVYQDVNILNDQTTGIIDANETNEDQRIQGERYVGFNLPSDCRWNPHRVNGMKEGEVTVYSKDNQIRVKCVFKNDKLNGTCIFYNNGLPEEERPYVDDVAEGWSKQYGDGVITAYAHYENGYKTEMYQPYRGDFWLYREIKFFTGDNEIDSYYCRFDPVTFKRIGIVYGLNGSELKQAVEYQDGEPNRTVKHFMNEKMIEYDNRGNVIYEGEYLDDIVKGYPPHGVGKEYQNNDMLYDGHWIEGRKEGTGMSFVNNKCRYFGNWKNDVPDGQGTLIDSTSNMPKYKGIWEEGRIEIDTNSYYDYRLDQVMAGPIKHNTIHETIPVHGYDSTGMSVITFRTKRASQTNRNSNSLSKTGDPSKSMSNRSSTRLPRNGVIDDFNMPSDDNSSTLKSDVSRRQESSGRVVDIAAESEVKSRMSSVSVSPSDTLKSSRSRDSKRIPEPPIVRGPSQRFSSSRLLNHSEGSISQPSSLPPVTITPRSSVHSESNTMEKQVKINVPLPSFIKNKELQQSEVSVDVSSDLEEEPIQPNKPQESQSIISPKSQPEKLQESQPNKPQEPQPVKPQESKPFKSQESQPNKPQESQPNKPQESQPNKHQEPQPIKPLNNVLPIPEIKEDVPKAPELVQYIVGDGVFNDLVELVLNNKASLSLIKIGNGSYKIASRFEVTNLARLTTLIIGKDSFNESEFGSVVIKDCPKLTTITIQEGSFLHFHRCELTNLPSLEKISIDSYVFYGSDTIQNQSCCELTSLPKLKTVSMNEMNFFFTRNLSLKGVPRFEFSACNPFQRITSIDTGDYGKPSCLNLQAAHLSDSSRLKNSLEYMIFDSYTGNSLKSLVIKHFNHLKLIKFNYFSFRNLQDLRILHNPKLEMIYVGYNCFDGEMKDGYLKIVDCKHLKQIFCMQNAFAHYTDCDLIDLPDLMQIELCNSFNGNPRKRKNTLEMKYLLSLSTVTFESSFFNTSHVTIIDVPSVNVFNRFLTDFSYVKKSKLKSASKFHEVEELQPRC